MVTDYDCWHSEHEAVTVDAVIRTLSANADKARALVKATAPSALQPPATPCPHGCQRALEYALITTPGSRDPELMERLDAVAGRVLRRDS
jgi:5'-methylthioadenosine phosphorylase